MQPGMPLYNVGSETSRMPYTKPDRRPVEYIYLDGPGIESLYAQIVHDIETLHTKTTQKGISAKAGAGLKFKNYLVKLLSGLEGELSAEVSGSGTITEQSTRVIAVEHKLARIRTFLSDGKELFFTDLGEASRQLQRADGPVFIDIKEKFNAPQFYGGARGAALVNADGYLLLEKGGAADYCDQDDYYRRPTAVVKLSANISKMRSGSVMGATSHDAIFFRGFSGRQIPLNVFGSLTGTSDFLQIKPFAIWK